MFNNYQQGKINSILYVFFEILQRSYKVVVLGALGMPGQAHPNWYYQFVENFCVYLQVKYQFISHAFLEILQRYSNLFWILRACLGIHNQNDSANFYKTSMFICMPKVKFIIHFFLEILHFKEPCNFIG